MVAPAAVKGNRNREMSQKNKQHSRRRKLEAREKKEVQEQVLKTERIQIERKTFEITLKENPRGRFVCIAEEVGSHRDMIIVPGSGLEQFSNLLNSVVQYMNQLPPLQAPAEPSTGAHHTGTTGTTGT